VSWQPPDHDPEQERRVRAAFVQADRDLAERLFYVAKQGSYERAMLSRDAATYDDADRRLLRRMAWHYRRRLPAWARPTVNPDDPIVRESEQRHD
jgi:hypothetical protein